MQMLRKDKKDEEDAEEGEMTDYYYNKSAFLMGNIYLNLEKTAVLQEARTFNESPLNPKKCIYILTKMLTILARGDKLGKNEATEAFFAMTKLFQSKDQNLRRMVYLVIKEMSTIAEDVIIVTSSLTKDMTGPEIAFRSPAIRALCKITDSAMLQSIERYMKQAVVDKNSTIASAALCSALHLMRSSPEIVRRWSNEVQEAASSDRYMVQYHALGLLYQIRKIDRLAVMKMVQKFTRSSLKSPYAHSLMIRIATKQIEEEGLNANAVLFDFVESSLRHKSEIVVYEAARAIVSLRESTAKELAPAISVLQLFCGSHKPAMRYAAVRTLNHVAMRHPAAVTACNLDLDQLITDSNRSIATLAITTLLKTGSESSVDRLMKQISSFMNEITDEFKIVVVESIRSLASKYPRKYSAMLTFLSGLLRDNSGYKFKKAVVHTMEAIIKEIPEAKNAGLLHLCEFIEDCEHVKLTQRILHLLGREGPQLKRPRKFIRYIYNRIMLESASIRCTATTALARFGACNEELLDNVLVLLQRIMLDEDDEVRDRATYFYHLLSQHDKALNSAYILSHNQLSASGLERSLLMYHQDQKAHAQPYDIKQAPLAAVEESVPTLGESDLAGKAGLPVEKERAAESSERGPGAGSNTSSRQEQYIEELAFLSRLVPSLGPLFKSSTPVELTESETEYVVTCVKHTYKQHVVLQYDCTNTMEDQLLESVYVSVECDDPEFEVVHMESCKSLPFNQPGKVYVVVTYPGDRPDMCSTSFTNTLHFVVKECEAGAVVEDVEGLQDEYQLEELTLTVGDSIQRVMKPNFSAAWDELTAANELEEFYVLSKCKTIDETIKLIVTHLGLQPCDRTDRVKEEKTSHLLLLAGVFRGGHEILVQCKLVMTENGVSLKLTVRSSDADVSRVIADAIG